jgi:ribosomal protein L2
MLIQIKKLSLVSCLELIPGSGSQYARSPGVKAKIVKFDKLSHSVLIQLPSGVKKIFSFYSFVLIGRVANALHNKCFNHKSGY